MDDLYRAPTFDEALRRELAQSPDDLDARFRAMINVVQGLLLARNVQSALSAQALAATIDRLADIEQIVKDHATRIAETERRERQTTDRLRELEREIG